jgi:TPR repeat protein
MTFNLSKNSAPSLELHKIINEAKTGNASAQLKLGELYQSGKEIKQNYSEAREWYEKASIQGNPEAQNNLAELYWLGVGTIEKNREKAFSLFQKAAKGGNAKAQAFLATLYEVGEFVSRNLIEAYYWWYKAALREHKAAPFSLKKIEAILSPEELAKAKKQIES